MEHTIPEKENTLQCRNQLIALASVALVGTVLGCLKYFIYYDYYSRTWVSLFPGILPLLVMFCAISIPTAALLYFVKYQDKKATDIAVLLVFIAVAVSGIVLGLSGILSYRDALYAYYNSGSGQLAMSILAMAVCALGCIGTFNSGEAQKYVIVLPIAGLVTSVFSAVSFAIELRDWASTLYIFANVMEVIATVAFYSSFLLFCLKNRIPAGSFFVPRKAKTVEQALAVLEDKRKLGIITEEEYQAERAKIIASL